jgi:isochorismate hydrolase
MTDLLKKRLANLLCIKSIMTLVLTGVFAYMAVTGTVTQEFMTVYTVVIAFYFNSQAEKNAQTQNEATGK